MSTCVRKFRFAQPFFGLSPTFFAAPRARDARSGLGGEADSVAFATPFFETGISTANKSVFATSRTRKVFARRRRNLTTKSTKGGVDVDHAFHPFKKLRALRVLRG